VRRASSRPSQAELTRFFLPLAASTLMMNAEHPLVVAAVSRLPDQAVMLAAVGVVLPLAWLVESPIIAILHAATRLCGTRAGAEFGLRFMRRMVVAVTAIAVLVFATPLRRPILTEAMGLPAATADAAEPAMTAFVVWAAAIGWRRFYQGLMIRHGRSAGVALAGVGRIATLTGVLVGLAATGAVPGAVAAALGLCASVVVEAGLAQLLARPVWARLHADGEPDPWTAARMWRLYAPLAMTSVIVVAARPLLTAGVTRAADAAEALPAWPVALSVVNVVTGVTMMVQAMAIAKVDGADSLRAVARFVATFGLMLTALLAAFGFTPLGRVFVEGLLGVAPATADLALAGVRIATAAPLLVAVAEALRGVLVRAEATNGIRLATLAGVTMAGSLLFALVFVGGVPGVTAAMTAYLAGLATDIAVLSLHSVAPVRALASRSEPAGI